MFYDFFSLITGQLCIELNESQYPFFPFLGYKNFHKVKARGHRSSQVSRIVHVSPVFMPCNVPFITQNSAFSMPSTYYVFFLSIDTSPPP